MDIRAGTLLEGPNGAVVIVESLLGRGGFGQVFAGRLPDNTRVAVKTLLTATLDENELRALQNDAMHAASVKHQNVVQVLHVSTGDDNTGRPPYFVMEFVDGGDLRGVIESHKAASTKPTAQELRDTYLQIAEGMAAVNAKVVHRDLKPENVLVDVKANRIKITDFGLAKLADAATRSETFKGWGTRPYQAPEAFEHGPNTIAMDMYAAGVTFFELAALAWPIKPKPGDNSPLAWRNAHLLSPPADLRVVRPELPQDLYQLITLMLQKDPARRPASWNVVIDRLKKGSATTLGRPDVSALIQKATATLVQTAEREVKHREALERESERQALLVQAFREPLDVLRSVVETFNEASEIGKLRMSETGPFSAEVKPIRGGASLLLSGKSIADLVGARGGMHRIIGMARIEPAPSARSNEEIIRDRDSFGSFNLAYYVSNATDRFGNWTLFRFEHNPLTGKIGYPRWFAHELHELPRQLQLLNAMGSYQHETRALDDEWFKSLLSHLL